MSTASEQWSPGSRKALRQDLGWSVLGIAFFGALALWEPFSIGVSPTTVELVASIVLGTTLGIAILLASTSDIGRRIWAGERSKFVYLFTIAIGIQVGIQFISMWTVLTMLASFIAMVPARLYLYRRANQQEN